jgi:hypothetical protein
MNGGSVALDGTTREVSGMQVRPDLREGFDR